MTGRLAFELVRRGFRRHATYRAANFAAMVANTVFGLLIGAIMLAAIRSAGHPIAGYDAPRVLAYVWLAQAMIGPVAIFRQSDIAERIMTGDLATDLARPADFQSWWFCDDIGRASQQFLMRSVLQFAIGAAIVELYLPPAGWRWAAFFASLALAVMASFSMRFIMNLLVFFTVDGRGPLALHTFLIVGLSGMTVPIGFYPPWLATVLRALPWYAMVQGPIDVYLGLRGAGGTLALQLVWTIVLLALGRSILGVASRRLVVQGG